MQRLIALGAVGALILSACAAATSDEALSDPPTTTTTVASTPAGSTKPETGSAEADADEGERGTVSETLPTDPKAGSEDDAATSGPVNEPGDTPPPADDSGSVVSGAGMPSQVVAAVADLASRLGVSVDGVDWVSMEEVDWPDGSLGCPQPDMSYTQAIVNGYKIVLEVDGVSYSYHGKAGADPFLCIPNKYGKTTTTLIGGTSDQ